MVDTPDENGVTPLMYAALEGNTSRIRQLLSAGADAERQNIAGRTALMFAALQDQIDAAQELVGADVALDTIDAEGRSALLYAAEAGHVQVKRTTSFAACVCCFKCELIRITVSYAVWPCAALCRGKS